MPRSNAFTLCALSLALAALVQQTGRTQTFPVQDVPGIPASTPKSADVTCKIYALADLVTDDATYGNWIADTILNVIEPDTWTFDGNYRPLKEGEKKQRCGLSYYAPSKVLMVYHTPAVHAKVDVFLKELKHASAKAKPAPLPQTVQQAQFVPGSPAGPSDANAAGAGYPVPGPVQRPKHLFHYVIRYEGEGLIDSNVVKFAKELISAATKSDSSSNGAATAVKAVAQSLNVAPASDAPLYLTNPGPQSTPLVDQKPMPPPAK